MRRALGYAVVLLALTMGTASAVSLLGENVSPADYQNGMRSTPLSTGVYGAPGTAWEPISDGGNGFEIEWDIDFAGTYYNYSYRFRNEATDDNAPFERNLSHWIVQTSDFINDDNWESYFWDVQGGDPEFGIDWGPLQGGSNPGLTTLRGVKFDYTGDDDGPFLFSFSSTQRPVWGHFYAKSARDAYAMNAALYDAQNDDVSGYLDTENETFFVPTVDTRPGFTIPEPGTMALGVLGLAGCALVLWRRQQ
ncbi:MAG: PEP-CTERM sorting domain-containing protein [Planctomycetota bacterium]